MGSTSGGRAAAIAYTLIETARLNGVDPQANVYSDELRSYAGIPNPHETVNHSARQYVDGMAHTNGIESFCSKLKKAYHGTYYWFSHKHLDRYVGQHNMRDIDVGEQVGAVARGMVRRRIRYLDLIEGPRSAA